MVVTMLIRKISGALNRNTYSAPSTTTKERLGNTKNIQHKVLGTFHKTVLQSGTHSNK